MHLIRPIDWLQWLLIGVTLTVAIGFSILVEQVHRLEQSREQGEIEALAMVKLAEHRARLEAELNAALYLPVGLMAYLHAHGDNLDEWRVERALRQLYHHGVHVRNVALAPDNTIRFLYPLAGNEAAIGLHYPSLPDQWPDVERAMVSQQGVLAGPVSLVQGGRGLIHRLPVFLPDGDYWGIISLVVDIDSLLAAAGLSNSAGDRFALVRYADDSMEPQMIFGHRDTLDTALARQVVQLPGHEWHLLLSAGNFAAADRIVASVWLRWPGHFLAMTLLLVGLLFTLERQRAVRIANEDPLTGLANRRLFMRLIEQAAAHHERRSQSFALIYIDLDGFKPINDQFGHDVGDRLLIETARRLEKALPRRGLLARLGGDEFVALLPDVSDRQDVVALAETLIQTIEKPLNLAGQSLKVGASAGVAMYPDDALDVDHLVRLADQQMYARKSERRLSALRPDLY